jgi:peroxiredoxin Q/BCP
MPQSSERVLALPLLLGDGRTVRLSDHRGRWLVLYFYPKDNTPGCTLEGIDFNALLPAFRQAGADILGVSRDSVKSHAGFCAKHGFGFDLVSDPNEELCRAFDVIREKSLYGRRFIGVERSTFLLDPQGRTVAEWRKVKVPGHAESVLAEMLARQGGLPGHAARPATPPAKAKPATARPRPPAGAAKKAAPAAKKAAKKAAKPAAKKAVKKAATKAGRTK